jgi:hypothetical protein
MRWIVCLLLVSMWLLGQFTGFSIADQPHLPLIAAAGIVMTRQRHAIAPQHAPAAHPAYAPQAPLASIAPHASPPTPALGR